MPQPGHTTIEMSPHRNHGDRRMSHEHPRAHEGALYVPSLRSRSPSPNNDRRHHNNTHHSTPNHDRNHLNVNSPRIPSEVGFKPTHSNDHLVPNDHHAPIDTTPLLHRPTREAFFNGPESTTTIQPDDAKPKPDLKIDIDSANERNQALKETIGSPKPPIAGPEIDDLDEESDIPNTAEAHPGVDDGFFPHDDQSKHDESHGTDNEGHGNHNPDDTLFSTWDKKDPEGGDSNFPYPDDTDGLHPGDPRLTPRFGSENPFPYAPEFSPGVVPPPSSDVNVNVYQQKKNLAQGMMDLALLSANANQLRYVLEAGDYHPYYYPSLIFISFSLILQIGVGVGLIVNSTYDIKDRYDICKADKINNFTVIGIFLVTVVNVFIASFGVAQLPQRSPSGPS